MRRRICFMALLTLAVALQPFVHASTPQEDSKRLTGDWNFTLTPLDANGNPGQSNISIQMSLQESSSMVYATCCGGERLFGNREGKDLRLQFLSHGVTDRDIKAGGVETAGGMDLKVKDNKTLQGEAVVIATGEGVDVFTRFAVTARRGQGGVGWSPSNICEDLHLGDLLSDLFSDATDEAFAPMDVCDANKNGGGYYIFGHTGPGDPSRPFATTTVYVPVELSGCPVYHSDRNYSFSVCSGGTIDTLEQLEAALQNAAKFLALFHVNAQQLVNDVDAMFSQVPQFALSIGVNPYDLETTLFISLGSNVSTDVCATINNSPLVADIFHAFWRGHGWHVLCGQCVTENYDLRRQIVPSFEWPLNCTSPVAFMYILGTVNVNYN